MDMSKVTSIQIGGGDIVQTLEEACLKYIEMLRSGEPIYTKISFAIKTKDGSVKMITIRDDEETIAYGDFDGLSSFIEVARALLPNKKRTDEYQGTN